jgi:pyrroloquinoline quinone biosynthesis protein B
VRVHVLGSAAGGGFPQWNCGCFNCRGLREGTIPAQARTQTSLAIEASDGSWFIVHASPDVRTQLAAFPPLHPRAPRDTPISGILLTNGDLDQCLGLLSLRESQALHVYATERVRQTFVEANRLYRALTRLPGQLTWHELKLNAPQTLLREGDRASAVSVTAVAVPGKAPLYLENLDDRPDRDPADNVALIFTDRQEGRRLAYAPCVGGMDASVARLLDHADCLFFDGTFWSEDELRDLGLGTRNAKDMAHWPLGGPDGSLSVLTTTKASRRILIHINNTNPVLREDSAERRAVSAAGVEVAYDGMGVAI